MTFTRKQTAAILAGLRLLQRAREKKALTMDIVNILTDSETIPAITVKEIDKLCLKVNTEEKAPEILISVTGGNVSVVRSTFPALVTVCDFDPKGDDPEREQDAEKLFDLKAKVCPFTIY